MNLPMTRCILRLGLSAGLLALVGRVHPAEKVYSGPQPGEKTTAFKSLELRGERAGQERDIITEHHGAPTSLIFVHGIERSMAPLLTVLDEYGKQQQETLKTEFIFLSADRLASQQRLPLVGQSLRLQSPMSLSTDGAEGPGNYGLNKECLLTVIVAKDNNVTANFALVQPGMADAPKILAALASVSNDTNPPTAESLRERRGLGGTMERKPRPERTNATAAAANRPKDNLPGAAPTDEKLVGLLRRFIQKSNDEATVDKVLGEVSEYVRNDENLTRQALDGWTRVLHLKYGTDYAQTTGKAWLEKLKATQK